MDINNFLTTSWNGEKLSTIRELLQTKLSSIIESISNIFDGDTHRLPTSKATRVVLKNFNGQSPGGEGSVFNPNNSSIVHYNQSNRIIKTEDPSVDIIYCNETNGCLYRWDDNELEMVKVSISEQAQADWDQTTTTADDYIKNKPTIPKITYGKYDRGAFYLGEFSPVLNRWSYLSEPETPTVKTYYIDVNSGSTYYYTGSEYVCIGNGGGSVAIKVNNQEPVEPVDGVVSLEIEEEVPIISVDVTEFATTVDSETVYPVTATLAPNKFYKFTGASVNSLTLTLTAPASGVLGLYMGKFTAGDGCTVSFIIGGNTTTSELTLTSGKTYEFNIVDGILSLTEVDESGTNAATGINIVTLSVGRGNMASASALASVNRQSFFQWLLETTDANDNDVLKMIWHIPESAVGENDDYFIDAIGGIVE